MMTATRARAAAIAAALLFASGTGMTAAGHDLAFWRAVARDKYALPPGGDVPALVGELTDMLASPDSETRDDLAYSTLASWIYQQKNVDPATLRRTAERLTSNLTDHVGERENDTIFRRSFSALTLAVIIARDNAEPFLDANEWRRIEDGALAYLAAERDLRGYDPDRGWMHSAAHTADLLKFLGRSRHLEPAGQRKILDAVGAKLTTSPVVFPFGEDERFARALLSLTARKDFDAAGFAAWLGRTKPAVPARPALAQLQAFQNWKNVLAKLDVLLSNEPQPSDGAASARTALRQSLKDLF